MKDKKDKRCTREQLVFTISAVAVIVIALWGIVAEENFYNISSYLMKGLKNNFSWLYLGVMFFFVVFAFVVAFSKVGKVKLGADDESPEYSIFSWFAMLFAAGMGVGLVFWGVAEPLSHYVMPMAGIESMSEEASRFAIRSSFMHWGLQPWACYAVMGLALAYVLFRKKDKALASNLLKPIIGEKNQKNSFGIVIDVFTVFITCIGVATSFGMGCLQICGGLNYLFEIPDNAYTWIVIIVIICICYLISATTGVSKGIKYLSNFNMIMFIAMMAVALLLGPTGDIIKTTLQGVGDYIINYIPDSLRMTSKGDASWIQDWRVFYWAWWLSWAPFCGTFIARISKGRTVREFILGVMIVPTLVCVIWFGIFGEFGLNVADLFTADQLSEMAASPQTALFIIFSQYKGGTILSIIAVILLITFFITSADSATFVLGMLTSEGNPNPSNRKKVFWGILMAVVAFALICSGGVSTIQTIAIVIGFPYLFILLLVCVSIWKALHREIGDDPK